MEENDRKRVVGDVLAVASEKLFGKTEEERPERRLILAVCPDRQRRPRCSWLRRYAARFNRTMGRCLQPASNSTWSSITVPGLPLIKAHGFAHGEPRGHVENLSQERLAL